MSSCLTFLHDWMAPLLREYFKNDVISIPPARADCCDTSWDFVWEVKFIGIERGTVWDMICCRGSGHQTLGLGQRWNIFWFWLQVPGKERNCFVEDVGGLKKHIGRWRGWGFLSALASNLGTQQDWSRLEVMLSGWTVGFETSCESIFV